ncbi:peptidoglycan DD-metalloendopeptidase family protein [uncultured Algimonas sp.]|uniref:murein hydrolase activator EnvC family protein n=1 Tax=uncultured Algimonas sp. TaxID=1547920 RepID=UPI0026217773|nr:peptidoglycan DD-metalloendopeptidase family protein [uncultured Algimonas sp.]
MRLVVFLLILLGLAGPVAAQQAEDLDALTQAESEARETEARLKTERETVGREIAELKAALARDVEQTRAFERESLRISERVAEATQTLDRLEAELAETRMETQQLLAALQRLQMAPSAAAIADPDDAVRTAQAATMIDILSRELRLRAEQTVALAARVSESRAEAQAQQAELDANTEELRRRRAQTEALVAQKEALQASIQSDEDKARAEAVRLASEAETLRELLERVAAIPDDITPRIKPGVRPDEPVVLPPGTVRFAEAKGGVVRPVTGSLTKGFGRGAEGQTYSARGGGQVLAPYAGRVEFVSPTPRMDLGYIVIINLDDTHYMALTGLGQPYVGLNEVVKRGEPIGRMPETSGRTDLYLELRRDGRPIDPEPWMGGRG